MVMYQNRMPKNDTSAKRPLIYNPASAKEIEHYWQTADGIKLNETQKAVKYTIFCYRSFSTI